MWITLLVMAIAISLEPIRIGMTVVMINRPRPLLQLLAFLAGGFAMGTTVGMIALFALRPALGAAHVTLPRAQLVAGALLLVTAAVVGTGVLGGSRGDGVPGRTDRIAGPLATRTRQLLNGRSLWTAGAVGLGIALPSVDYLAALAVIVGSGTSAATQVGAVLLFHVVAFSIVELPLLSYLAAPARTRQTLSAVHGWLRSRGRLEVAALLAAVGCVLLGVGFAGL
jgi:Sap, sulfolipid-1-addressing protein